MLSAFIVISAILPFVTKACPGRVSGGGAPVKDPLKR